MCLGVKRHLASGHEISRLQHGLQLIMARYTRLINCRPCCNLYVVDVSRNRRWRWRVHVPGGKRSSRRAWSDRWQLVDDTTTGEQCAGARCSMRLIRVDAPSTHRHCQRQRRPVVVVYWRTFSIPSDHTPRCTWFWWWRWFWHRGVWRSILWSQKRICGIISEFAALFPFNNYIYITQPNAKTVPNCDVSIANGELYQTYGHVTLTMSAWPKYVSICLMKFAVGEQNVAIR